MATNEQIKPATKSQIDALIDLCKEYELYNAAGFLQLASDELSEVANGKKSNDCCCFEVMGDNPNCPEHGGMFSNHGAFSDAEIKADYQERNDLYNMAIGA